MMLAVCLSLWLGARVYHVVPLTELATTTFTHVEVCGLVTFVKREGDGDVHVRMDDRGAFIVAEFVSYRPLKVPKVKRSICVRGISRIDKAHGWPEVHPVEAWWYARA